MQDTTATTSISPSDVRVDIKTVAISQSGSMTTANATPELCLLAAVIEQALRDVKKPAYREEAGAFIASENFEAFCEMLGWNVERVRGANRHLWAKTD